MGCVLAALAASSVSCSKGDRSGSRDDIDRGGTRDAGGNPFGNSGGNSGFNAGNNDGGLRIDAGALPPNQGDCGQYCFETETGAGTDAPFDITNNPSDRVGLDPDGALVIERDNAQAAELIWIANTREGTVSKVDTNTYTEIGRYEVAVDWTINESENGPSRTSVDSDGDVYAGARFGTSVTKISAKGDECPDTNGDGQVTTSTGAGSYLPLGQDDCVLWSTDIGGDARGVAVQEIPTRFEVDPTPDDPKIIEIKGARFVWVGGQEGTPRLHKLDAETGEILLTLDPPPAPTYGLALDGRDNLWIAGKHANSLARVDTTRCVDDTCNMETVCTTVCTEMSCPDTCDDAVLEVIDLGAGSSPYGITVDCAQRVWMGGAWGGDGVVRYDPLAPADERLSRIDDGDFSAMGTYTFDDAELGIHGIAADANGWIWGAGHDSGVWRIDAESLAFAHVAGTGGAEFNAKGMAVDRRGRVWAIPLRQDYAMVITPGATIDDAVVEKPINGFLGPYTYSDMSGEQRRLAANEPGSYRQVFEGCTERNEPTDWQELEWDVEAPDGTFVIFLARTADSRSELEDAEWFEVAVAPGRQSPIDIDPFIAGAGQTAGKYVEIEVRLFTTKLGEESKDRCTSVPAVTPRVKSFGVSFLCRPDLG
jgi:streptogramin lyase